MATIFVGARIPPSLHDKLSKYLDRVGATKSEVLTAALAQYLGATEDVPLSQKIVEIEQRLAVLEALIREISTDSYPTQQTATG